MGYQSPPEFVTMHALRIKGFATVTTIADICASAPDDVARHLGALEAVGHTRFRDGRDLWQLTPEGREDHRRRLDDDLAASGALEELAVRYTAFLGSNDRFKQLCTDWQLRDGQINDHGDPVYDRSVVDALMALHHETRPIVAAMGDSLHRLWPYGPRLDAVIGRLCAGDNTMFTGVMCGSYHDVWMELHEDLILTQGIDRAREGSY